MTRSIDRDLAEAGLPPLQRSAWVEVDLDQLVANARALGDLAGPAALGPVVKADGYGHGLEMAARCAVAGGATWLCVADAAEAERLRRNGFEGRILVLYPVPPSMLDVMSRLAVDVPVGSLESALALSAREADKVRAHLEIDTGMTRGGVTPADAVEAALSLRAGPGSSLAGVWTHLAAPEDDEVTATQVARFEETLDALAAEGLDAGVRHLSASGGFLAGAGNFDLVRPGLAYYGVHPGAGDDLPGAVRPAISVRAMPVRVAEVAPGAGVGYAGTWIAGRPSRIATLPIGYADGWSRSSSPGTRALISGRPAPLVGRVSSDSLTVDVTDLSGLGPDDVFTLLGDDDGAGIHADEVAATRGTISWEVLQQLGARLTRVYLSGGRPVAVRRESSTEVITVPGAVLPGYRRDPLH